MATVEKYISKISHFLEGLKRREGLTIEGLAKTIGLSDTSTRRALNKEKNITLEDILTLAHHAHMALPNFIAYLEKPVQVSPENETKKPENKSWDVNNSAFPWEVNVVHLFKSFSSSQRDDLIRGLTENVPLDPLLTKLIRYYATAEKKDKLLINKIFESRRKS